MMLCGIGCSEARKDPLAPPDPPIVWPKPPDAARVRYLGALTGSEDVSRNRTLAEAFDELLYGPGAPSRFVSPYAIAVDETGDRAAVADTQARCVHLFDLKASTYERLEACGTPLKPFACPVGVAWVKGTLWVVDADEAAIAVMSGQDRSRWIRCGQFKRPSGITFAVRNELCYVTDSGANIVFAFDETGALQFALGSEGSGAGQFNRPTHIASSGEGSLVVSDSLNFRVQRLGLDGNPLGSFGRKGDAAGDLALPKGVSVDAKGNLWVADAQFENVQAFTPDGQLLMALGKEGGGIGEFSLPAGVFVDVRQRLWVADTYNRRVQVFQLLQP